MRSSVNCGSFHQRYGYPERIDEIKRALSDAGHPLSNDNGNLVLRALHELIAERDDLQSDRMTLALRLYGEDPNTFAPETREVMYRMRPKIEALLRGEAT